MEKHNSRFIVFTLILCLIVSLFCGVSCSDSVDSGEDEVRMVNFSSEGGSSSRVISENTLIYQVEDLYWAYTAVKVSGQYTTGASVRASASEATTSIATFKSALDIDPVWKDDGTGHDDGTCTYIPYTDDERKAEAVRRYNAGMDGKNAQGLVLKPVKAGVAPGLRGTVGPFSVGEWIFTVYGYESYDETNHRFVNLIYTGKVDNGDRT
ncbi:MAG: hypothetical protein MJ052_03600, partial [Sphaerochaetaceae bacterium]|nr:hypothetical protein [Sphaerochaetaceae bacterium]